MNLIHILIQITLVNCNLKLKEGTDKIKSILNQYKIRQRRCDNLEIDHFVNTTVNFLIKNERFGDILNNYNISKCGLRVKDLEKHVSSLLIHEDVPEEHWMEYKTVFNKSYESNHHEAIAKTTWLQNLQLVAKHNREYLSGKISYSLQLNHFGDWHVNVYISEILKLISTVPLFDPSRDYRRVGYRSFRRHKVPSSLDWRDLGFKPRREEQWRCGACYAFAVTHAIQAQLYTKHRRWDELSPQQIVDCSYEDGNQGCNGGSLQAAFRYAAREGLARETKYPYRGKKGHCHHSWGTVRVRPRRWAALPARNEAAVERALANIGPLAVAVNAAPITFQLYRSGIYDDPFCVPWRMNHAMLLVGYTPQYWLLLNWWGRKWGEDGYIRIRRGLNTCGVSNMAMYVEL